MASILGLGILVFTMICALQALPCDSKLNKEENRIVDSLSAVHSPDDDLELYVQILLFGFGWKRELWSVEQTFASELKVTPLHKRLSTILGECADDFVENSSEMNRRIDLLVEHSTNEGATQADAWLVLALLYAKQLPEINTLIEQKLDREVLLAMLDSPDHHLRRNACYLIGQIRSMNYQVLRALVHAYRRELEREDRSFNVQLSIAWAVIRWGPRSINTAQ